MIALARPGHRVRLLLSLVIVAVLAYMFWTGSRYPSLNEKAMMSGAIQLEDPLGFEALIPLTPDMTVVERIGVSTVNWLSTNRKGMTFGILFAAAFLTMAEYLRRKSFQGRFANSVLGLVMGAPLGVCVNCAAPIARGMYAAGLRAETTLSAMIASPTLNVIVLTMLFSLFPLYMALAKIALSVLIILVVIPLICRALGLSAAAVPVPDAPTAPGAYAHRLRDNPSLAGAVLDVAASYLRNLWFIVKLTLPLMLLAGFLGAVVATLLPGEAVLGLEFGLGMLLIVGLVGVFLPVPIAFDVVVVAALMGAGLDPGYAMVLLFTLGSFSIYSFFIVAQAINLRTATALAAAVVIAGVLGGIAAHSYHRWQSDRALDLLTAFDRVLGGRAHAGPADPGGVGVTQAVLAPRTGTGGFTRMEAREIGIDKPVEFSMKDMWPPFWEGRSLASADYDRDGDLDLVVASTEAGLYLYLNDGTGRFTRDPQPVDAVADWPVFNAVPADMDNDGWPDLILATYRQGNWLVRNRGGTFDLAAAEPIGNVPGAVLSIALALDDLEGDGDLDLALGNWTAGWYRRIPGEESRNRLILNDDGQISGAPFRDLPGVPGETLSILFSDIDGDRNADLLVGNDFEIPDFVYLGDGAGGLRMTRPEDGLIPHTTTTTMAIKSADLMNDGTPELYFAQIAGRSSGVSNILKMQDLARYCDSIATEADRAVCERNMEIKRWYRSGNRFDPTYAPRCQTMSEPLQAECKAMLLKDIAIQRQDPGLCGLISDSQPEAASYCDLHFLPTPDHPATVRTENLAQILRSNVLLRREGAGYADVAEAVGLDVGGWSWDTKIADFDGDGWQDVYIVNGTWVPNEVSPSNLYFRNLGDGTFAEASGPMGLEDYLMTAAATAFDADGDGDLDLLTHPVNGPLRYFRNDSAGTNLLAVALRDGIGNRDGIGALVEVTLSDGTRQQREIQLGGGFMSFDAPRAHFGLGTAEEVSEIVVHWRGGETSRIEGPLPAGMLYTVSRDGGAR